MKDNKFKILAAPNSMKGSLCAIDFADAIEDGFRGVSTDFEIRKIPVADGGDFTGEILKRALNAKERQVMVLGPLGDRITASYWHHENTAIIEMANASGMKLISREKLNPMRASSFGTGELIKDAIETGCTEILLAIGGSATVDGGTGMLEALGFIFFDKDGDKLAGSGSVLSVLKSVQIPENLSGKLKIRILCDVNNPLNGPNGAAEVFGPQKGADPEMVRMLDTGLRNWSELIINKTGKNIAAIPRMGAAGGISTGLVAFMNAQIVPGADFVLDLLKIDDAIEWSDLVITGEGKLDLQSLSNKAPGVLAFRAKQKKKPVIAITGINELKNNSFFNAIFSITDKPMSCDFACNYALELVKQQSSQLAGLIKSICLD